LFLLLMLGTCVLLVTLLQAITVLTGLPQRAKEWRTARRDHSAQAALREALAQYFGGRYSRSEKAAQRALTIQAETSDLSKDNEFTVLAHLLRAGSAHRLQDRVRRDEQLMRALDLSRRSAAARSAEEGARLLAAEWALDDRDASRALALLAELPPGVARRTHALRLKLQATRLGRQPQEALKTARLLAKHQGFSKVAALGLMRSLAFEALDGARDVGQVHRVWQQLEPSDRKDPFVAARAALCATALGAPDDARAWLRPFWDQFANLSAEDRLVLSESLVRCIQGIGPEWLVRLEAAALAFSREGAVAHAVGTALAELRLWGKATLLLKQAAEDANLAAASRRHALRTLGRLAEQDDKPSLAAKYYADAAKLDE
jgi:HemY protein